VRQRPESGQWVFWQDRVGLVLAGRYQEVLPLHVEVSPTFLCNFACTVSAAGARVLVVHAREELIMAGQTGAVLAQVPCG